jgi:hypothetical protein
VRARHANPQPQHTAEVIAELDHQIEEVLAGNRDLLTQHVAFLDHLAAELGRDLRSEFAVWWAEHVKITSDDHRRPARRRGAKKENGS